MGNIRRTKRFLVASLLVAVCIAAFAPAAYAAAPGIGNGSQQVNNSSNHGGVTQDEVSRKIPLGWQKSERT